MPFSQKTLEEKPYNVCVTCNRLGVHCDGPNFFAMEMQRLSEWCRIRKDYLHRLDPKWTNAYIADQAGVSKVSVDRFIAGTIEDIKMSTIARILRVLVNGTWGKYPCAMSDAEKEIVFTENPALVERAEKAEKECDRLQGALSSAKEKVVYLEDRVEYLKGQISFKETQMKEKDAVIHDNYDFFRRKNRIIAFLSTALSFALAVIVCALLVDKYNPNIGFFWVH